MTKNKKFVLCTIAAIIPVGLLAGTNIANFKKQEVVEKKVFVRPLTRAKVYTQKATTGKLVIKDNIVFLKEQEQKRNERDIQLLKQVLRDSKSIKNKDFDYSSFKDSLNDLIEALKLYR